MLLSFWEGRMSEPILIRCRENGPLVVHGAVKVVDHSEETEEDGTIVLRERERFTNELTLVWASGETDILR